MQILSEEEAGGTPIFSNETICQIVRMYGHVSQSLFAPFLEQNMKIFAEWQNNIKEQSRAISQAGKWLDTFGYFDKKQIPLMEWQKSLQQQALLFWQNVGFMPKDK